jgi:uncharacterized OsmC-like protein
MSEEKRFTLQLEQLEGYEFRVVFDLDSIDDLVVDEPPPLGGANGPNPSRLLATAAANCLGASLLYCISKNSPPDGSLRASAECTLSRNDKGRLRIGGINVTLEVSGELEQSVRTRRCLDLYEDFCVVTASLREGFPISARVVNEQGETLHESHG